MWKALSASLLVSQAAGHGWLVEPLSKNELQWVLKDNWGNWPQGLPEDFRYEPFSCANGNNAGGHFDTPAASCGAKTDVHAQGLSTWQQWYNAGGVAVPQITPGSDMKVKVEMSTDHGGQHWVMIACGNEISESSNWTMLERAAGDRTRGYLPSNPNIYAWPVGTGSYEVYHHVPSWFSCPGNVGVGRWLWKTGNTCNDANNIGRSTESFSASENAAVGLERATCAPGQKPETFISCFDFTVSGNSQPTQAPTPAPTPPPTQAPTTAPTLAPSPPPTPAPTPAPPPGSCNSLVWGQCGGEGWTGPTCCESGLECKVQDDRWFHQCVPISSCGPEPPCRGQWQGICAGHCSPCSGDAVTYWNATCEADGTWSCGGSGYMRDHEIECPSDACLGYPPPNTRCVDRRWVCMDFCYEGPDGICVCIFPTSAPTTRGIGQVSRLRSSVFDGKK